MEESQQANLKQEKEADAEQAKFDAKEKRREEARQAAIEMSKQPSETKSGQGKPVAPKENAVETNVTKNEKKETESDKVEYRLQVMALNKRLPKGDRAMKITDVEAIIVRQPEITLIGDGTQDTVVIQVHTDEGITGVAEVDDASTRARGNEKF